MWVLVVPLILIAYCGRLLIGSPSHMILSDEERNEIREVMGEEALQLRDRINLLATNAIGSPLIEACMTSSLIPNSSDAGKLVVS